jgi:bifunctional DNase/RNase
MPSGAAFCNRFIDSQFHGPYILGRREVRLSVEIEMAVKGYFPDPITNMPIILLREKDGQRVLPIWVGFFEANAIHLQMEGIQTPRPMTHDLLKAVIEELGAHVQRVVVCDLKDNTFYATVHVESPAGLRVIDARPSDAIALALRSGARIYVEDSVIQSARSVEEGPDSMNLGRLQKWLSDEQVPKYKM